MQTVRVFIFILIAVYLLLALGFTHITLGYQRQFKKSAETLNNLFVSQSNLFAMLSEECGTNVIDLAALEAAIKEKDFKLINKLIASDERALSLFLKTNKCNSLKFQQINNGINENTTLIRNEVYRYNKLVENLNVNRQSVIFSLSVAILQLKEIEKI